MIKIFIKEFEDKLFFSKSKDSIEYDYEFDLTKEEYYDFVKNKYAYTVQNGKLVKDLNKQDPNWEKLKIKEIRDLREQCFKVVNRGLAWYNNLTDIQKQELQEWYQAWLDAPETLIIPEKPTWLK
jgi:hypothetical protein